MNRIEIIPIDLLMINKEVQRNQYHYLNKYIISFYLIKMTSNEEMANLDKNIEQLKQCKPLKECQVKSLCDKVLLL